MMDELPPDGLAEVTELLQQGKKLSAVKRYKELTGSRLGESKKAVEKLAADLPSSSPSKAALESKSGCLGMILLLVTSLAGGGVCLWWMAGFV